MARVRRIPRFGIRYGSWWAVQWVLKPWVSFGIHLDFSSHPHPVVGQYGPYADVHFLWFVLSIGRQPAYSSEFDRRWSASRGGLQ